jgi:hypothetical protein
MNTETIEKAPEFDLSSIPADVLERALEQKKEKERKAAVKAKEAYETSKFNLVEALFANAVSIHMDMVEFKREATEKLNDFYEQLKEYGDVRSDNKGTFTIWNEENTHGVEYCNHRVFSYDERAIPAAQKIKQWLEQTVKKRDKKAYNMISKLLEKSRNEDYDPNNIAKLYSMEKEIGHPLFTAGVEGFKEAWTEKSTKHYIRFHQVDAEGEKLTVQLNWSNIKSE